jgi:ketosteroid isomerase-like protein
MMTRMLLTTALLLVATPWATRAADEEAEKAVATLSKKMTDALVKGDIAVLDGIMADDWIIIDPVGKVVTKAESLGDIKDRSVAFHAMDKSELKPRLYGDTAVVNGRLRVRFTFRGKEVDSPTRFTEVYVRQAGRWRCVSTHVSAVVTP